MTLRREDTSGEEKKICRVPLSGGAYVDLSDCYERQTIFANVGVEHDAEVIDGYRDAGALVALAARHSATARHIRVRRTTYREIETVGAFAFVALFAVAHFLLLGGR